MDLTAYVLVGAGSAAGGVLRHAVAQAITTREAPGDFPWGILWVNLSGCLVMGMAFVLIERSELKLLVMSGILGGFTTFSAFSVISLDLLQRGRWDLAGGYVAASVFGCLLAVWVGAAMTSALRGAAAS